MGACCKRTTTHKHSVSNMQNNATHKHTVWAKCRTVRPT